MTTTRTARSRPLAGLAALLALGAAPLAGPAAPAAAAPQAVRILNVSSDSVRPGESVRVRFRVTNNQSRREQAFVLVSGGLRCTVGCSASLDLRPGQSRTLDATLVAPEVGPGETGLNLAVGMRLGNRNEFDHKMITVRGGGIPEADKPPAAVSKVSGRVRAADGKAVGGATVTVRDSAGHSYRATADADGAFSITSSDSRPIAAGRLTVVATRDGYRTARTSVRASAGRAATVRLTLTAVATPATTPPSPSAAASSAVAAEEPAVEQTTPPAAIRTAGEPGGGLPLYTVLGALLIAAGVGALALMLIRRRNTSRVPAPPAPAAAPVGASHGGLADAPTAVLPAVPPDRTLLG